MPHRETASITLSSTAKNSIQSCKKVGCEVSNLPRAKARRTILITNSVVHFYLIKSVFMNVRVVSIVVPVSINYYVPIWILITRFSF